MSPYGWSKWSSSSINRLDLLNDYWNFELRILYESTGLYWKLGVSRVHLRKMSAFGIAKKDPVDFVEGFKFYGVGKTQLVQILWKSGPGHVFDRYTFEYLYSFEATSLKDWWSIAQVAEKSIFLSHWRHRSHFAYRNYFPIWWICMDSLSSTSNTMSIQLACSTRWKWLKRDFVKYSVCRGRFENKSAFRCSVRVPEPQTTFA